VKFEGEVNLVFQKFWRAVSGNEEDFEVDGRIFWFLERGYRIAIEPLHLLFAD